MTETVSTTSVYADVWRALFRLLDGTVWPAVDVPGVAPPKVFLTGFDKDGPRKENVVVITDDDNGGAESQEWGPIGRMARDELMSTRLYLDTRIPNRDQFQALDRIEQLTKTVEQLIRTTVRPAVVPFELQGRMKWWAVGSVSSKVGKLDQGGFAARSFITVNVNARV